MREKTILRGGAQERERDEQNRVRMFFGKTLCIDGVRKTHLHECLGCGRVAVDHGDAVFDLGEMR
jgi:hypothetical protein